MNEHPPELLLRAGGKGKSRVVTAKLPDGDVTIIGRYDLVEEGDRDKLVQALCSRFSSLDRDDVQERVLALALATEAPESEETESNKGGNSQADRLVQLAETLFEVFPGDDGETYAIRRDGPRFALSLTGSHLSLRQNLAKEFYKRENSVARSSSLSDAMLVIGGLAEEQARRQVHLRSAKLAHGYEIDIGDETGRCIFVDAQDWEVRDRATVHFYRTALTMPLAEPERGGDLDEFWQVMNVAERDRPLVLAYAVTALLPDRESPVLMSTGPKGTGKSSTARCLVGVVDPCIGDTRTPPTRPDQWSVTAAGSRIVALDNVSGISTWQSDAYCRASTGDAYVARLLYSNRSLSAVRFRIALIITTIDAGAIRDDFGDRCVLVESPEISRSKRVSDYEIKRKLAKLRGRLLGALLDLVSKVLAELPKLELKELPRIGDYYYVLAAVDRVLGTNGIAAFDEQAQRVVADVLESDITSMALLEFMDGRSEWRGTCKELLTALWPERLPKGAPTEARGLSSVLRRMASTLRVAGLHVEPPDENDRPRRFSFRWLVGSEGGGEPSDRRTVGGSAFTAPPSAFSDTRRSGDSDAETVGATGGTGADRTAEARRSDGPDGCSQPQNEACPEHEPAQAGDEGWV